MAAGWPVAVARSQPCTMASTVWMPRATAPGTSPNGSTAGFSRRARSCQAAATAAADSRSRRATDHRRRRRVWDVGPRFAVSKGQKAQVAADEVAE